MGVDVVGVGGKGVIKVASSHWDILGWGVDNNARSKGQGSAEKLWMVTYFIKTVFTPSAVDIYSRDPAGLSPELVQDIKKALKRTGHPELVRLTDELYECQRDNIRHEAPIRRTESDLL